MNTTESYRNPLPRRFREVSKQAAVLKSGQPIFEWENDLKRLDIANAAQGIVINEIHSSLERDWCTPDLDCKDIDFYTCFVNYYFDAIPEAEKNIWSQMKKKVLDTGIENLTPADAATVTLLRMTERQEIAASSQELFVEVSHNARVYEYLLRDKWGTDFTPQRFYECLRKHLPSFLKQLIAMDSVILNIYRILISKLSPDNFSDNYWCAKISTDRFMLKDDDSLQLQAGFFDLIKKHAEEDGLSVDFEGRRERRGCPFLRSEITDSYIKFVIEEFISQHKKYNN